MKKRIISILLAAVMVVAMVPATLIAAFAEESSDRVMTLVGNATLDGQNTDGEYDNATAVMLNAYGNDTDGDNMRIIYTDEAIYVLVEVFDDTLVRYADGGSSKCDFVFLGFSVGNTFQGMKRVYRDTTGTGRDVFSAPGAYVNMSDGDAALETEYFGYTEDENGFRLEARFPVDEMSAQDRALYELGQLEIRFTAGTQDGVNNEGTITFTYDGDIENRDWDGKATEDYFESGSYKAKNPSNYPEYAFEYVSDEEYVEPEAPKTDYMAYVTKPTFDGQNTNGEYDNAYSIPFTIGLWGETPKGNESLRVVYSDDAIYVLIESIDDTDNSAGNGDFFALSFAIGTSFVSTQIDYRQNAPQYTNQGGTVSMSSTWSLNATYFKKTVTADKISFEAMFPVANMNAEDQAAFADGTLSVKIGAAISDNWIVAETFSGVYNGRTSATSPISGATPLTFAEKYEYPDATVKGVHYVKNPTLDGVNTNGEYDNSYVTTFDYSIWSTPTKTNEFMKVMYSDGAIYVLIEFIDDVATTDDFIYFNYNVGSSYVGNFQFNRLNANVNSAYSKISGNDVNTAWLRRVDTATGWTIEAMFPVSSMTTEDQAAFAEGTLGIGFSVAYLDAWGGGKNGSVQTHTNAYSKGTPAHELTMMPKGAAEDKTPVPEAPYVSGLVKDGEQTPGEYDGATTIVLDKIVSGNVSLPSGGSGTSKGTVPAGSYYKIAYADDGIYVFVNIADTTPAYYAKNGEGFQDLYSGADTMDINFNIGNSYKGYEWSYRHGTMGATNTGAGSLGNYPGTQKDYNAAGWAYEIKFPLSGMTEEDKEAFANGTLDIGISVRIADRTQNSTYSWGAGEGVVYSDNGLGAIIRNDRANCVKFTMGEWPTNYKNSVVLDGVNTNKEYDGATVIYFPHIAWSGVNDGNQTIKVVYSQDAIYVLAEFIDSNNTGSSDFFYFHFRVGTTYRGTKLSNREDLANLREGVNNQGGAKTLPETSAYVQKHFTDAGWSVEYRFPVADLTAEERAAYAAGTLDVAFGGSYCSDWGALNKTENFPGYTNATADDLALMPAIEFGARDVEAGFAGANLALGQNINVNYYANIPYDKAANAFVKFTYNGKTYIVKPVAATDRIDSYVFTFENLAPQCIGDEIDATLMVNLKAVDTEEDYSALKNCENLLGKHGDKVDQLIYDLLAYGAAAQVYAGYKTDALVNAGYEDLASDFDLYPSVDVTIDGADTNGEYDGAITVAIDKEIEGTVKLPSGYNGYSIGDVPTGSYYKVLFTDDAIFVYVNIADTTPAYNEKQGAGIQDAYYYADTMALNYKIGNSFIGKDWSYRHGTMIATNTGAGTLGQYPSKHKDNNAEGWGYEIVLLVADMTAEDQAAYAAGTLSVEFNVEIADRMVNNGWGFYDGVIYSDNTTLDAYTSVSVIDKVVGEPNVPGAVFSAAGVYHGNANKVYAKVSLNGSVDVSTLTVTIDGVAATLEATETAGVYIVFTDDVKVTDFDRVYTFALSDSENTQTLEYSVNAYSIIKAASGKTQKTVDIAKALYNYGVSAEAYIAG